uniref:2-methoxy-6-polyprenyl-1,4-benzoquinol methylase, mitochondrial n=1 Tax=Panagrolaimus sp. PS1159 TaxID=55785 RepID=A0AC35GY46_9BILA
MLRYSFRSANLQNITKLSKRLSHVDYSEIPDNRKQKADPTSFVKVEKKGAEPIGTTQADYYQVPSAEKVKKEPSTFIKIEKDSPTSSATTHFGYQQVPEDEKQSKVHTVFANVADKYDLMNDAMSVGVHRLWKDYFTYRAKPMPNSKCVDVAGGTGDIAFRLLRQLQRAPNGTGDITVFDINQSMLDVGMNRAQNDKSLDLNKLRWICGNAEALPFENNSFDLYTIAFGIRNCTHIDKVLSEAYRVLKPRGRFMCLEFSKVNNIIKPFYEFYSFQIIPVLGQVLASDYNSYKYLVESIRMFPDQQQFARMINDAGFTDVSYENLSLGICSIHTGVKK